MKREVDEFSAIFAIELTEICKKYAKIQENQRIIEELLIFSIVSYMRQSGDLKLLKEFIEFNVKRIGKFLEENQDEHSIN